MSLRALLPLALLLLLLLLLWNVSCEVHFIVL
jgi:hypothetical protein